MTRTDPLVADLRAGPAAGEKIKIKGVVAWPEWLCLNLRNAGTPMHYAHIAAGVYEFRGPCMENYHTAEPQVQRCPDCGSRILTPESKH